MGATKCNAVIAGDNVEEILEGIVDHTVEFHGIPRAELLTQEMQDRFRSAIRQAGRPAHTRSQSFDL
jgi:predicted small metal-binding protein